MPARECSVSSVALSDDCAPGMCRALCELSEAYKCAIRFNVSPWDFAVEIGELWAAGVKNIDLRSLICAGYIEHTQEILFNSGKGRQFHVLGGLSFNDRSCFVLTAAGEDFARVACIDCGKRVDRDGQEGPVHAPHNPRRSLKERVLPHWDCERHELRVLSHVVKRFKSPALNQEIMLMVFEEEGWPPRIDDPLPPQPELDSKRRLHDTIKCLNRHQLNHLIHFRGDGTGEGVVWEFVERNENGRLRFPDS